jgi:hypothetical protein
MITSQHLSIQNLCEMCQTEFERRMSSSRPDSLVLICHELTFQGNPMGTEVISTENRQV